MAADRRVTYQLAIKAGQSSAVLRAVAADAEAAAAAIASLTEAQTRAAGAFAGLGRARAQAGATGGTAEGVVSRGSAARDPEQAAARAAEAAAAREAKAQAAAVAKAERAAAAEVRAAEREYEKQRAADIRNRLGAIRGNAALEIEAIDRLEAKLAELGRLSADTSETLIRRRAAVEADAERQAASLASRGVSPTMAFGTRGTRQTTIGSGVLSGFFDRLFSDLGEGGAKLDNLKDAAGRADSSLKNLAGALGVVSPGAGAAATAAGDLVGSLEVLLTPAGATVGVLAGVAAGLAAAGAAAVGAVMHIAEVADELAKLDAIGAPTLIDPGAVDGIRDAAAAVQALSPAFSALVGVLAQQVAPAVEEFATSAIAALLAIRKALDAADLEGIFEHLGASIVKTVTLPTEGALRAVAALATARNDLQEAIGLGRDPLVQAIADGAQRSIDALEDFQVRAGRALVGVAADTFTGYAVGLRSAGAEARDEAEALVDAVRTVGDEARAARGGGGGGVSLTGGVETELADVSDAAEVAADAMERLRDIINDERTAAYTPFQKLTAQFAEARLELDGLRTAAGPAGAALADAAERALLTAEASARSELVAAGVEAANRDIERYAAERRADMERRMARTGEAVDSAGAAVGQLSQGNVVGAIGAATGAPAVQIVGDALGALATLGELGAEEIRTRGETFARAVAEGLRILPELIIDVLPDLVVALVSAIGDALADLPDRIADAVYTAITGREASSRGSIRAGAEVVTQAASSGDPLLVGAIAAVRSIGDRSRSRSAAEADLMGGVTLPGAGGARIGGPTVAIAVRGSGVGLARAIEVDAEAPYISRRRGVRP
jgi:hypothetical protein